MFRKIYQMAKFRKNRQKWTDLLKVCPRSVHLEAA